MPDIAMCKGGDCPMRERCYRFTATPTPMRQAYFMTPPYKREGDRVECKYLWPTEQVGERGDK